MAKHLPKDRRRTIIVADFWDFIQTDKTLYDRIIVDIYTTADGRKWRKTLLEDALPGYVRLRRKYGEDVSIIIHGFGQIPQHAYNISEATGHDITSIAQRLIPENLQQ